MTVRTARLGVQSSAPANAEHTIFTVPAGQTWILKDIRVSVATGTVARLVVFANSGPRRVSLIDRALGDLETASAQGFFVLEPGDNVGIFTNAGNVICWCSGSQLDGVAP